MGIRPWRSQAKARECSWLEECIHYPGRGLFILPTSYPHHWAQSIVIEWERSCGLSRRAETCYRWYFCFLVVADITLGVIRNWHREAFVFSVDKNRCFVSFCRTNGSIIHVPFTFPPLSKSTIESKMGSVCPLCPFQRQSFYQGSGSGQERIHGELRAKSADPGELWIQAFWGNSPVLGTMLGFRHLQISQVAGLQGTVLKLRSKRWIMYVFMRLIPLESDMSVLGCQPLK